MKKKTVPIIALMILLFQSIAAPIVAVAESLDNQERTLELRQLTGRLLDDQEQAITTANPVNQEGDYWLELVGTFSKESQMAESFVLEISNNMAVGDGSAVITNDEDSLIGDASVVGQTLHMAISADTTGSQNFKLKVPVSYQSNQ